jgi:hypothetical protein
MNHSQAVAIDQREIRGINAKHIAWLIGTLFTILVSIMGTYYSSAAKQDKTQDKVEQIQIEIQGLKTSKDIQDAQIKALNLQMQALELRIVRMETVMGIQKETAR